MSSCPGKALGGAALEVVKTEEKDERVRLRLNLRITYRHGSSQVGLNSIEVGALLRCQMRTCCAYYTQWWCLATKGEAHQDVGSG